MRDSERELCRVGSVEAAAVKIGIEAAEDALISLIGTAPEEVRASWPMVIQWSRMQLAYEDAMAMGDVKLAAQIAKMSADMISGLY